MLSKLQWEYESPEDCIKDADSLSKSGMEPGLCISNKLPRKADAAGPGATFWKARHEITWHLFEIQNKTCRVVSLLDFFFHYYLCKQYKCQLKSTEAANSYGYWGVGDGSKNGTFFFSFLLFSFFVSSKYYSSPVTKWGRTLCSYFWATSTEGVMFREVT